jgi:Ser/Thr protein kinase RdoA (MazF antagonist)
MPKGYGELSSREQVSVVRGAVTKLLALHGLGDRPLALVLNSYNITFRLEMPFGKVAIRVNTGSTRSLAEVRGEIAWTAALAAGGEVRAPEPVSLFSGSSLATVSIEGIEREVPVVAYGWLEGRHVGKNRPTRHAYLLGQLMSDLHASTQNWSLPEGATRPVLHTMLDELPWRLPDSGPFAEIYERANAVLNRMASSPRQLIHFDLHFGNVKVHEAKLCVFDFDDSVIAWPGVDASQAMFYLRREGVNDRLETAFWEGSGTSVEGLGLTREEFEILVGGRALLLATDLAGTSSAKLAAIAPKWIETMRLRVENLLATGEYDPRIGR